MIGVSVDMSLTLVRGGVVIVADSYPAMVHSPEKTTENELLKAVVTHDQTKNSQVDQEAIPIDRNGQSKAPKVRHEPLGD